MGWLLPVGVDSGYRQRSHFCYMTLELAKEFGLIRLPFNSYPAVSVIIKVPCSAELTLPPERSLKGAYQTTTQRSSVAVLAAESRFVLRYSSIHFCIASTFSLKSHDDFTLNSFFSPLRCSGSRPVASAPAQDTNHD
jgi:hypothetical protein